MKRDVVPVVLIALLGMLFLLVSCTTTKAEVAEPVQAVLTETVPVESPDTVAPAAGPAPAASEPEPAAPDSIGPSADSMSIATPLELKRYMQIGEIPRYGGRLVFANATGYPLHRMDLFSEAMYLQSDTMGNLLGSTVLEDQRHFELSLAASPVLQAELQKRDGSIFILNAIDTDGDMYYLTWDPELDPWYIEIPFDALDLNYQVPVPPSQGDHFAIKNRTGSTLESLFLIDPTDAGAAGVADTDLLGEIPFQAGTTLKIPVADVPWIASQLPFGDYGRVLLVATDTDGAEYRKTWYPTTDLWLLELTGDDLQLPSPEDSPFSLKITNDTDIDFWYLYLATPEMFSHEYYGEELLGAEIFDMGETISLDLSGFDHLYEFLNSDSVEPLYLVGIDAYDEVHSMPWNPRLDSWDLKVRSDEFRSDPMPPPVFGNAELRMTNETGADIWFFYLVNDGMLTAGEEGKDALGEEIWYDGESFEFVPETFRWVLDSFIEAPERPIHLIGYTSDWERYQRTWSPSVDGWKIVLTKEDKER